MATILLAAAGSAVGAGFGGTMLGLTGAVIGRAVGATVGRVIDQRLLGSGARSVETGRIDRLRLQTAGEGTAIPRVWGQMRVPGHVIWASPVTEISRTQDAGGKSSGPRVTEITYRLSLAIALCEGPILSVGRVWADGEEVAASDLNLRVYLGDEAQLPDPVIAAHQGEAAPAYRGIAYVVLEDLALERWGNRVPQLSFEVTRGVKGAASLAENVQAVALIPGTGEYALATRQVSIDLGLGETRILNRNTPMGGTDFQVSLATLGRELPKVGSVSLVVSWFGDDLRAGHCTVRPKVEQTEIDGEEMPWRAGGIGRTEAATIARKERRSIYGGTPSDGSVVEAIRAIRASGKAAVFYPFVLMEQVEGNGRPDPWSDADDQPVMPWRGRVTTSVAAGRKGSPQGTAAADAEVAAFFGAASVSDFAERDGRIVYSGPQEWGYRRFILHYAHLCRMAGGIDAFLIGSEMIGLTQIRGAQGYPAVAALRRLAAEVRGILGAGVRLGYAADWSEYFGHHPGGGEAVFHLDPLWGDENIDFVGIDNYMPLSDWREGEAHLDAHWGDIHNVDYLRANVCGGEGYDWYYVSDEHRLSQVRTPITDGQGEPWIWRYKDLKGWWSNWHYDRVGGQRSADPTAWVPGSKPIWFTEYGCAALDKGTNQPNKFLDTISSESMLPWFSDGRRDDAIQAACVEAVTSYWADPANNPAMKNGGRMVELSRAHVWAWDARPYPAFPARGDLWSDGLAWERGHWLNGRAGSVPLADVVRDICEGAGVAAFDVSGLHGVVRGYAVSGPESGRAALQPLMLSHGFDAVERDGSLRFVMRDGRVDAVLAEGELAVAEEVGGFEITRAPAAEMVGRVRLSHVETGADYGARTAEAALPDGQILSVSDNDMPMVLTPGEGHAIASRWLVEAKVAQEAARFALPPSRADLGPGDVVRLADGAGAGDRWRIDRVERAGATLVEAVRVEPGVYRPAPYVTGELRGKAHVPAGPVWPVFLDLPLMRGTEMPHAPWLAATGTPWPGAVRAWVSVEEDGGWQPNVVLPSRAVMGVTLGPLLAARPGVMDRGPALRLRVKGGNLRSVTRNTLLAGGNVLAIGDGSPGNWELMQFSEAKLVAPGEWEISGRLRGQAGTDALMPAQWPAGSVVVLMDGAPRQVELDPDARGQLRHWRIGPSSQSPDDESYRARSLVAAGAGLRPLSPCHLSLKDREVTWVRRTRTGGDGWDAPEVPLGEAYERYVVRLVRGTSELHREEVSRPAWTIPESVWTRAAQGGGFVIEVAQLSEIHGPGPSVRRNIHV